MDITNVVTLLVDTAKQLHAAKVAAEQCSSDAESLFKCVSDNTLLIEAAVQEGLHASSSNPAFATMLCNAIDNVVKTLSMARDAYYRYLLTGRVSRFTQASTIQDTLRDVRTQLNMDMNHLHHCVSLEIWRLVKSGQTPLPSSVSDSTRRLPEQTAKQLAELQLLPNTSNSLDKEVVKQVARLAVGSKKDQERAVVELKPLSAQHPTRAAVATAGAIPPLVRLLNTSGPKFQEVAAAMLAHLAINPGIRPQIVRAGGIPALLEAAGSTDQVKKDACCALANLASHNGPDYKLAIMAAEGIPKLVRMLHSNNDNVRHAAARALEKLALCKDKATREAFAAAGGIGHLVGLLNSSNLMIQESASASLANVAATSSTLPEVVSAGAVPSLVRLLDSSRWGTRYNAAGALATLAQEPGIRPHIVSAGGIPAFLRAVDNTDLLGFQKLAARALAQLASHRDPDYKPAIVAAGGIPILVGLLGSDNAEVHGPAAEALLQLSNGGENEQKALLVGGAIPPLVRLLDSGNTSAQISDSGSPPALALSVLLNLAQGSQSSAVAIKAAGAGPLLEKLLLVSSSLEVSEAASKLLGCLS